MKLESAPLYPVIVSAKGIPTNLVRNLTPSGKWQIARVVVPGGPAESDFDLLFEGSQQECERFLRERVDKEFPGLISQV